MQWVSVTWANFLSEYYTLFLCCRFVKNGTQTSEQADDGATKEQVTMEEESTEADEPELPLEEDLEEVGQKDRQTDRQTDKQIERQTNRHIDTDR